MLVERKKYLNFLLKQKDKDVIKIITGLRRSGKSTLLFQLFYKKLLDMKVKEDHIILSDTQITLKPDSIIFGDTMFSHKFIRTWLQKQVTDINHLIVYMENQKIL